jgi:hypothetical protein
MRLQPETIRYRLRFALRAGIAIHGRPRAVALASDFAFNGHPRSADSVA